MSLAMRFTLSASMLALAAPAAATEPAQRDEIIVTASPLARTQTETISATSVIAGENLERRLENSIGETLRREPGVSSTFFGPGASRPVIRGLGGDRISVLDAGLGSLDASQTSPDHAVAVEPATAQRIEIIRGPQSLLYGSSAAGGVVNVFSGRIPREAPEGGFSGSLRAGGSTVDDGFETAGGFDATLAKTGAGALVFHGDGFHRRSGDYAIPGYARSETLRAAAHNDDRHEEEAFGAVDNTFVRKSGGAAGLSFVFDRGFFGVSGTAIDTKYGLPVEHEHHHDDDDHDHDHAHHDDHGVEIDLRQRRLDFDGEIEADFLLFSKTKLRIGHADYRHAELDDGIEETIFETRGWEGRLELVNKETSLLGGALNGAVGYQFRLRDFSAVGEEAFVPPTGTGQHGFFAVKELTFGALRFDLGGRYERTRHEIQETGFARDFNSFSVSGGVGAKANEHVFLGVSGYRTERAPSVEELFSNGPHLGVNAFEIGDPGLGEEIARGVEAAIRYNSERLYLSLNGYYTSYRDFIYEARTGEAIDGLDVLRFFADDATFRGFEAQAKAELFQAGRFDIHADASLDMVRARLNETGAGRLPRIPPLSGLLGFEARAASVDFRVEGEFVAAQTRTAALESPTDGYALLNAFVTLRPFASRDVALRLSASNLTNAEARLHPSHLKELFPLPGRNFRASLQVRIK